MGERVWNEVVAAFGGDPAQAEAEVAERWQAMQRVDPEATREAAIRQLVWEYTPRPIEHVFPGDNWYFMIKAVQSPAHILVLDLEDAVATTRKQVARTVMILLIRAFRGHVLTEEEVKFLKLHALPAGRAEQLEQQFRRDGARFQIKPENRFPASQMILVRPNNLRTKWAAGDYFQVIREIGDLIAGIYLPKVEGPEDVRVVVQILRALQQERGWMTDRHKIFVQAELPGAVLTAEEILAVAPEVEEVNLGVVDYTAATGGRSVVQQEQYTYMRYPLLRLVEAAQATGKAAGTGITVTLNADDTEVDTVRAIVLGIHRKASVHPAHIEGIARHATHFPPILRKRIPYPDIPPFDLTRLERLSREEQPILPPIVFVPRPVTLCRSVVTVAGQDLDGLRAAFASTADMVIMNVEGMPGRELQRKLAQLVAEAARPSQVLALQMELGRPQAAAELQELLELFRGRVHALILPSVDQSLAIRRAAGLLTTIEREVDLPVGSLALGARITTPEAVEQQAYTIATASRRMMWLFLDLPEALPKEDPSDPITKGYYYCRSALLAATAAADIDAIDGMSDAAELEEETLFAANLGFQGKVVTPEQAGRVNAIMNPPRAGERPSQPKGPETQAFHARWINSVERALEILELYAIADQDRNLGAVAYSDPVTGQREMVDAATARIYYRQLERALKARQLTDAEAERYRAIPDVRSSGASKGAFTPTTLERDRSPLWILKTPSGAERTSTPTPLRFEGTRPEYREAPPVSRAVPRHRWSETLWLGGISGVMALVQLPFASYVASLPLIREEWGLNNTQAGMIYSAYLAGLALAALFIIPLTDRFPPRRLFVVSVWGSVIANLLFPLWAMDFLTGSLLRFVAGPCLVGVYVPGIRIVSERFAYGRRGTAVGVFVSAFHLGISVSLAVMSLLLHHLTWRPSYLIAALLAFSAVAVAHLLLRDEVDRVPEATRGSGRLSLVPLRTKPLVLLTAGYALHAWELYVVRVWLPPFLAAVLLARGMGPTQAAASAAGVAALMLAIGASGPFLGGLLSDRIGRAAAAVLLLSVSGAISFTIGWMAEAPWWMLVALGTVYGFATTADSAIYSTGVTELADPQTMGSAQAFHTFFGYAAAVLGPVVFGGVLDLSSPRAAWGLGFSTAGIAAALGVAALLWLYRLPESAQMARGRAVGPGGRPALSSLSLLNLSHTQEHSPTSRRSSPQHTEE